MQAEDLEHARHVEGGVLPGLRVAALAHVPLEELADAGCFLLYLVAELQVETVDHLAEDRRELLESILIQRYLLHESLELWLKFLDKKIMIDEALAVGWAYQLGCGLDGFELHGVVRVVQQVDEGIHVVLFELLSAQGLWLFLFFRRFLIRWLLMSDALRLKLECYQSQCLRHVRPEDEVRLVGQHQEELLVLFASKDLARLRLHQLTHDFASSHSPLPFLLPVDHFCDLWVYQLLKDAFLVAFFIILAPFALVTATAKRSAALVAFLQANEVQLVDEVPEDVHEALVHFIVVEVVDELQAQLDGLLQVLRADCWLVGR